MKKKPTMETGDTIFFPVRQYGTSGWYAISGTLVALGPRNSAVWVDSQSKMEFPLTERVFSDFDTAEKIAKGLGK